MGQISFEQAKEFSNTGNSFKVGFFSLKNDGDEAVVRFMHDSTDSFDIVASHTVQLDGKSRKVNCIRDAREPLDNCPLCKNGMKIENKIFIHLIQYTKDESGRVIPEAKIWERSLKYAKDLAGFINEYGPLSDCVFKVRRNGAAGSKDTTYQILLASPQVYTPEIYVKKPELFEGYSVMGSLILNKTYDELNEFLITGKFPYNQDSQAVPQNDRVDFTGGYVQNTHDVYPTPQYMPVQQTLTPVEGVAPWETSTTPVMQRPVRTY